MSARRRLRALLALGATSSFSGLALGGLSAGPELDVGALHPGPKDQLPGAALAADSSTVVAAYLDTRGGADDYHQLFFQVLLPNGGPSSQTFVATGVEQCALFPQRRGPLIVFTQRSPRGVSTFGASVRLGGTLDGPFELGGLLGVPTALACQGDLCIASTASGLQRLDLGTKTASLPFTVPATNAVGPTSVLTATHGDEVVAVSTGKVGATSFLLSAELDFDGKLRRPFTFEAIATSDTPSLGLIAGSDDYLAAVSVDGPSGTQALRLALLDHLGHLVGSSSDVPLDAAKSWQGAWAGGAYRLVLGGNNLSTVAIVEGSGPVVTPDPLSPASLTTVTGAAPSGDDALVASLVSSNSGSDGAHSNLVRVGLDGSIVDLPPLGLRPSQQLGPLLAARGDRYLVAYQEWEAEGTSVRYALLDVSGRELGIGGKLEPKDSLPSIDPVWSLTSAEEGFLLSKDGAMALIDDAGKVTALELALPDDTTRRSVTPVLGGGVVLALIQHSGHCGEDCAWWDVGAQFFALDGSALDAGPLFGPAPKPSNGLRSAPQGVWNGREFVVFSHEKGLQFLRIGADRTLIDRDWRALDAMTGSAVPYALAAGGGVTLAVWSENGLLRGGRVFQDGMTDAEPLELAALPSTTGSPSAVVLAPPCAVAYDGTRFVVAWQQNGVEHAVTVSSDGTVGSAVTLTSPSATPNPHDLALASRGDGHVLLGYDRFDPTPYALTSRIKIRVLADGPAEIGSECNVDADCASSFCVGGTCCDTRCDEPGMSCGGEATGGPDGTCAPETKAATDAGAAIPSRLSCDVPNACPPEFTCDPVKLVCIPPVVAPSAATRSAGCGCRSARHDSAFDVAPWLFALFVAGTLRARSRRGASAPRCRR